MLFLGVLFLALGVLFLALVFRTYRGCTVQGPVPLLPCPAGGIKGGGFHDHGLFTALLRLSGDFSWGPVKPFPLSRVCVH